MDQGNVILTVLGMGVSLAVLIVSLSQLLMRRLDSLDRRLTDSVAHLTARIDQLVERKAS